MRLTMAPSASLSCLRAVLRPEGLDLFEPSGQDGRKCQYLAMADQLRRVALLPHRVCDADLLEAVMLQWLEKHHDDCSVVHASGDAAALSFLSDAWTDGEYRRIQQRTAWGDHILTHRTHVIAVIRDGVREAFRLYDNDSEYRQRGTFEPRDLSSVRMNATWYAVMAADSPLSQHLGGEGLTTALTVRVRRGTRERREPTLFEAEA